MAKHPRDRFDEVPDDLQRVGAHRAEPRRGRGWIAFAWAALATGVLVGAGVVALGVLNDSFQFVAPLSSSSSEATEAPTDEPTDEPTDAGTDDAAASTEPAPAPTETVAPVGPADVDPSVTTIAVLNGTTTSGLAGGASTALEAEGWTIGAQGNADDTAPTTIVYYGDAADEGLAAALAADLGVTATQQSSAFPGASVTIVLGSDYTP